MFLTFAIAYNQLVRFLFNADQEFYRLFNYPLSLLVLLTVGLEQIFDFSIYLQRLFDVTTGQEITPVFLGELAGFIARDLFVEAGIKLYIEIIHPNAEEAAEAHKPAYPNLVA